MTRRTLEVPIRARPRYGWRFHLAPLLNRLPLPARRRAARWVIRHSRIDILAGTSRIAVVKVEPRFEPDGALSLHPVLDRGPRAAP